jgi:hypothetical protein
MPSPQQVLSRQSTRAGRLKMLLVLAICAAPVVASYFTFYVIRPTGSARSYGTLIQPTVGLPDVPALQMDGSTVSLRSLKGQWLIVTVDDAACPQACERRLFMQRQLREMMGRERDRVDKVWLVVDDQPVKPELRQALEAAPGMNILRVPRAAVAAWLRPDAGHALQDHLYLVDPMGEWMMRMPPDADPNGVKRDLERLLRASVSWDLPGR